MGHTGVRHARSQAFPGVLPWGCLVASQAGKASVTPGHTLSEPSLQGTASASSLTSRPSQPTPLGAQLFPLGSGQGASLVTCVQGSTAPMPTPRQICVGVTITQ